MKSEYFNVILDLLIEDYFNLYEVFWFVKSRWDSPEDEALDQSIDALRALYKDGYVNFFERDGYTGKIEKLSPQQVDSILRSHDNWKVPTGDSMQIVVTATSKGEEKITTKR